MPKYKVVMMRNDVGVVSIYADRSDAKTVYDEARIYAATIFGAETPEKPLIVNIIEQESTP